jgi:hypothetical protein
LGVETFPGPAGDLVRAGIPGPPAVLQEPVNGHTPKVWTVPTLMQVYSAHKIPTYVVFDNDAGTRQDRDSNRIMCRLLGIGEKDTPPAQITARHAVLGGDWETQMKADLEIIQTGLYDALVAEARQALGIGTGRNKPLVARYVAEQLIARGIMPAFVSAITRYLKQNIGLEQSPDTALANPDDAIPWTPENAMTDTSLDDEIPF